MASATPASDTVEKANIPVWDALDREWYLTDVPLNKGVTFEDLPARACYQEGFGSSLYPVAVYYTADKSDTEPLIVMQLHAALLFGYPSTQLRS